MLAQGGDQEGGDVLGDRGQEDCLQDVGHGVVVGRDEGIAEVGVDL